MKSAGNSTEKKREKIQGIILTTVQVQKRGKDLPVLKGGGKRKRKRLHQIKKGEAKKKVFVCCLATRSSVHQGGRGSACKVILAGGSREGFNCFPTCKEGGRCLSLRGPSRGNVRREKIIDFTGMTSVLCGKGSSSWEWKAKKSYDEEGGGAPGVQRVLVCVVSGIKEESPRRFNW